VVHLWVKVENERRREMEGEIYTAQQCLILAKFNSMARVEFDIYTDQYEWSFPASGFPIEMLRNRFYRRMYMLYKWQQGCRNGGGGACPTPQILTDQLTLSQLGGRSYPPHYYSPPRIFRTSTGPLNTIKESICSQTIMNTYLRGFSCYVSQSTYLVINPILVKSVFFRGQNIELSRGNNGYGCIKLSSVVFSELIFSKSNHLFIDNEHNRRNFSFCNRKHRLEKVFILVSVA
jgi:hypothetical protein